MGKPRERVVHGVDQQTLDDGMRDLYLRGLLQFQDTSAPRLFRRVWRRAPHPLPSDLSPLEFKRTEEGEKLAARTTPPWKIKDN